MFSLWPTESNFSKTCVSQYCGLKVECPQQTHMFEHLVSIWWKLFWKVLEPLEGGTSLEVIVTGGRSWGFVAYSQVLPIL